MKKTLLAIYNNIVNYLNFTKPVSTNSSDIIPIGIDIDDFGNEYLYYSKCDYITYSSSVLTINKNKRYTKLEDLDVISIIKYVYKSDTTCVEKIGSVLFETKHSLLVRCGNYSSTILAKCDIDYYNLYLHENLEYINEL